MPKNDVNYGRYPKEGTLTDVHMTGNYVKRARGQRIRARIKRELKQQFLQRITVLCNVRACCRSLGISHMTFYQWLHCDPDFAASYQALAEPPVEPFIMPAITVDPNNIRRRMLAALRRETDRPTPPRARVRFFKA